MFQRTLLRLVFALLACAFALGSRPQIAPASAYPITFSDFAAAKATSTGYLVGIASPTGEALLASAPLGGGPLTPLTAPHFISYVVSPTGDRVVFYGAPYGVTLSNPTDASRYWSVSIAGGTAIMLSEPTYAYPPIMQSPKFSGDGQTLVYVESDPALVGGGDRVLKSRLVNAGSPAARLSPDSGIVAKWAISPDNQWVVMWIGDSYGFVGGSSSERWTIQNSRVMRVALHGPSSGAVTLDSTPGATGTFGTHAFSPDGSHMIYVLNGAVWSTDLNTGAKAKLSPDGQLVDPAAAALLVNAANIAIWNTGTTGPVFATPVTGPSSASRNLSAGLPGPLYSQLSQPVWKASPGGDYVVMRVNDAVYSVAVNAPGGLPVLLADGGSQGIIDWIAANRLVYMTGQIAYSIPLQGPTGAQTTLQAQWVTSDILISPDGSTIAGAMYPNTTREVFSVPVAGPSQSARNESYGATSLNLAATFYWFFAPDSQHLIALNDSRTTTHVFTLGTGPITQRLSTDCSATPDGIVVTPDPSQVHQLFLTSVGRCILTASSP